MAETERGKEGERERERERNRKKGREGERKGLTEVVRSDSDSKGMAFLHI